MAVVWRCSKRFGNRRLQDSGYFLFQRVHVKMTATTDECMRKMNNLVLEERQANDRIIVDNAIRAAPGCISCENLSVHIPTAKNRFEALCSICRDMLDIHDKAAAAAEANVAAWADYKVRSDTEKRELKYLVVLGDVIQSLTDKIFYGLQAKKYTSKKLFFDLVKAGNSTALNDLYTQLHRLNVTKGDFDVLVIAKDYRNSEFHCSMSTAERLLFLRTNREVRFEGVWKIVEKYRTVF